MAAGATAPDHDPGAAAPAAPSPPPPARAATDPLDSPATPEEPATRPAVRQTILVVEDEPALLRALRINLRARGYEPVTVQAGRPALEQATQRKPDVVILDLGLPDIDGMDLIRELRLVTSAPVIVLSGRTGPGDKIGALDAGADDYVTKPFSMEELLARLRAALRRDGPVAPERPPDAHRGVGTGLPAEHPLPALPHGRTAPEAGGRPGPPPSPADRARHGLPLLALITARRRGGHTVSRVSLEGEKQHHG
jgi:CheY-like chemotaxis protein